MRGRRKRRLGKPGHGEQRGGYIVDGRVFDAQGRPIDLDSLSPYFSYVEDRTDMLVQAIRDHERGLVSDAELHGLPSPWWHDTHQPL